MNDAPVITFEKVSKKYLLGLAAYRSLRDEASKLLGLLRGRRPKKPDPFWALKDVSLQIRRGETVGIIGPNGAGKSTALKLIARITQPSSGTVRTSGRVASLIERIGVVLQDREGHEVEPMRAALVFA